jgi:hypothetical protein
MKPMTRLPYWLCTITAFIAAGFAGRTLVEAGADINVWFLVVIICFTVNGCLSAMRAADTGRDAFTWTLIGTFVPFGWVVLGCLPSKEAEFVYDVPPPKEGGEEVFANYRNARLAARQAFVGLQQTRREERRKRMMKRAKVTIAILAPCAVLYGVWVFAPVVFKKDCATMPTEYGVRLCLSERN